MKAPRPYKVKLNSIKLYDCETLESAQDLVQLMRTLKVDSTLNLHDSEIVNLLGKKSYKITISNGGTNIATYDLGMFYTYINAAFNRYYTRLAQRKGA